MPAQVKPERIQKILANSGLASRRMVEAMIQAGRITVNGRKATLGDKADISSDTIEVDGIPVETGVRLVYFALNKPRGVITTVEDPRGRTTVLDLIPERIYQDLRLYPVGRLDMDSSGLILLTNDGLLSHRLLHPSFEVPRKYVVEVEPVPRGKDLALLREGIELEEGNTGPARVSLLGRKESRAQISMVLHTGRKRQVRRSFEKLGYRVESLCRIAFGNITLRSLGPGEYRELTPGEVRSLYRQTNFYEGER